MSLLQPLRITIHLFGIPVIVKLTVKDEKNVIEMIEEQLPWPAIKAEAEKLGVPKPVAEAIIAQIQAGIEELTAEL